MPTKHCRICGAFAVPSGLCPRCGDLDLAKHRQRDLEAQLANANLKIAAEKRYRVHVPEFFWETDRTWTEAVEFAKRAVLSCVPYKVEIRDEKGRVIRTLKLNGGKIDES